MAWLRLDDGFADHPKIDAPTNAELRVWLRVLCQCARLSCPTVDVHTRRDVRGLSGRRISRFVEVGLLDEIEAGSFEVHAWTTLQPRDPTADQRQARSRARRL
jgi:hypothetical protein